MRLYSLAKIYIHAHSYSINSFDCLWFDKFGKTGSYLRRFKSCFKTFLFPVLTKAYLYTQGVSNNTTREI